MRYIYVFTPSERSSGRGLRVRAAAEVDCRKLVKQFLLKWDLSKFLTSARPIIAGEFLVNK